MIEASTFDEEAAARYTKTVRRVLLLDHFDSFTFNLAQGLVEGGASVTVRRVDSLTLTAAEREALGSDLVVLGPGPGRPEGATLALDLVARLEDRVPILGICLGHQVLALCFGGRVDRAPGPCHGKASHLHHDGRGLFTGLPNPLTVGRYHSLAVTQLPDDLEACAWAEDGTIQAIRHRTWPLAGLQFHPDSFLTPRGGDLLRHALALGH